VKDDSVLLSYTVGLVNMSEYMQLRLDLYDFLQQVLASSVFLGDVQIQNAKRRAMSDKDIDILWNHTP
jgi:hypothetical protein